MTDRIAKHRFRAALIATLAFVASLAAPFAHAAMEITGARVHEAPDYTRAVFDTSTPARFTVFTLTAPDRVVVDLDNAKVGAGFALSSVAIGDTTVKAIRGAPRGTGYRIVLEVAAPVTPKGFTLVPVAQYGDRLVIERKARIEEGFRDRPVGEAGIEMMKAVMRRKATGEGALARSGRPVDGDGEGGGHGM